MKRFFSKEKSRKEKKADFYILYTIVFAAISLFIYSCFYFNGKSLIWSHDGVPQHINALAYYGKYLRNVLQTLVTEHKLSLPMWDMHIGYGSDILTTLHYYAIGDPLNLIYVFSNKSNIELLYNFMLVFRLYLAGVAFIAFGHYLKKDGNGILAGSIVYIFSGTFFSFAIRHPFFLNPMIYLPLLLMGVEKIYRKEKPYLFILMVTVAAISNFYFFYMLTVAAVVYALIRFPEYKEAGFFRKNEKRLAREQRKLSRCVRGSHNYELQKKKVARCHEKIRNQRRDHLHKLSRKIADGYDAAAVEDIDMKAMGQCLHFGKSVQDNGYGMFREMLDYKLAWKGKKMVKVDRFFPSSKKCCKCGRIKKELKLSERVYHCVCGNKMDRDRNAAINIREEARRMLTA